MEEITLEEFISCLDESYRIVFDLLEDETLVSFAKHIVPMIKEKGLTAETLLFDEELKTQIDLFINGSSDKLLAIEALLKGYEYLEQFLESISTVAGIPVQEDIAQKMVTYYMIQYILAKKSKQDVH